MKKLSDVLKSNLTGMYYGNRVLLPFECHVLKIVIENDLLTDFSSSAKGAEINIDDDYMEIYFHDYPNLAEVITDYENIKMVVVERGKDIFNFDNHLKIVLHPEEKHILKIEQLDDDTIFID